MLAILIKFLPDLFAPMNLHIMLLLLLLVFLTTFVIPVLSLLGLYTSNIISNIKLEKSEERKLPLIFITFFYAVTSFMFVDKLEVNSILLLMLVMVSVQVALLTIITFFWKISIHSAGIGGMTGFMLALAYLFPESNLLLPLVILVLLSGLLLSARMYLNAHIPLEVYSGYAFGFILSFPVLLFWN